MIPSKTAVWFEMDSIADIEKYSLPEFFRGVYPSKTPSTYKEYRNFMIRLYRMNPMTYVTATSKFAFNTANCLWFSVSTTPIGRCMRHRESSCFPREVGSD